LLNRSCWDMYLAMHSSKSTVFLHMRILTLSHTYIAYVVLGVVWEDYHY